MIPSQGEPAATTSTKAVRPPEGLDGFLGRIGPVTEIKSWTQERTGSLCRELRSEALGRDVFLKQVPHHRTADVAVDFGCLDALYRGTFEVVPEPLGWGTSPPYIACELIPCPLLSERLDRVGAVDRSVAALVASCGRGLAQIHSVDVASLPAEVRLRDARVRSTPPVASVVDLGPWNCLVLGERVVFIDVQLRLATPEFDVGRMSVALSRAIARGRGPSAAMRCAWRVARTLHAAYDRERSAVGRPSVSLTATSALAARKALTLVWSDLRRGSDRPIALAVGLIAGELAVMMGAMVQTFVLWAHTASGRAKRTE